MSTVLATEEPATFSLWQFFFGESAKMKLLSWLYSRAKKEREALKFRNKVLEARLQDMSDAHVALKAMVAHISSQHMAIAIQNGYQPEVKR